MTQTDRLRAMLDERGVEWRSDSENVTFWNTDADVAAASQGYDGMLWVSARLTPEQAIAATLGNDGVARSNNGVTAEQVREAIEENSWAEAIMIREFNDSSWQAIADELNATLGAGTCRWEYPQGANGWVGYMVCSGCGEKFDECVTDIAHYCPNCGRRCVE